MGEMIEIFKILKEENRKYKDANYDNRIKYAIKLFETNNIPYKLCNETNAHFNLYDKNGKVCMSFWAWTGKVYSQKHNINSRGIKSCCKIYNKLFTNWDIDYYDEICDNKISQTYQEYY